MITHIDWVSIFIGVIAGGSLVKIAELCIAWAKERREKRAGKTAHEKDRPRFRVDITKGTTSNANVEAAIVKILSLGSLPLTINHGEVFIEAGHYPGHVEPKKLENREISAVALVELQFSLPSKLIHPLSGGKPLVKLICRFSYGMDNQQYYEDWTYNRNNGQFE
jgi:hypothetical protein